MTRIDVNIWDWINYRPNVGVEALHIIGLPGTGKSNMASALATYCMKKGEHLIIPGDRFCEWRHYLNYHNTCNVKVIIPSEKMVGLTTVPEDLLEGGYFIEKNDYKDLDVISYLDKDKPTVLAIYDACFSLHDRSRLWVEIFTQLLNRTLFLDKAITVLFHEAGIYWPEMARGKHWECVDDFASLFVDCRKGLVRPILVSQIEQEIESTIRGKCMVRIHRKGFGSRRLPIPLQRVIPYTALNEYHLQYGGLYVRRNIVEYFKEKKILYKIIPRRYINGDSLPFGGGGKKSQTKQNQTENVVKKLLVSLLNFTDGNVDKAARLSNVSPSTIRKYREVSNDD